MYNGVVSKVRVGHEYSDEFSIEAITEEFKTGCPWELLYADDLVLIVESLAELEKKFQVNGTARYVRKELEEILFDEPSVNYGHIRVRGNEMAQMGHYAAAIDLFTEAIRLDPSDFRKTWKVEDLLNSPRFIEVLVIFEKKDESESYYIEENWAFLSDNLLMGDRLNLWLVQGSSYAKDSLGIVLIAMKEYSNMTTLKDAEKSISISSNWPKGFFRKGRALAGQKQYSKAEEAFLQVIRLDKNCEDARQELLKVQMHQLAEMGFTKLQAEAAITQYGTVQTALDSLLAGIVADNLNNGLGSEKEFSINNMNHITINSSCSSPMDTKMDPANPEGLTALWVGNVLPEVSEKKLNQLFSRYGPLSSVRCLPDRFCAFINFKTKESAGKAMNSLQGVECGGQKLLIKFPDNPIINVGNVTILKASTSNNSKRFRYNLPKQSGPVNGNECYFWRTTGCQFGDKCHYHHFPDHKGIDLKPWHKVK
uniref:C3H1-type domain-containing protein n=1 Tax=Octopus bimaculoides TaxID=37653 RepID=A0A0L8HZZ1_OCTBM